MTSASWSRPRMRRIWPGRSLPAGRPSEAFSPNYSSRCAGALRSPRTAACPRVSRGSTESCGEQTLQLFFTVSRRRCRPSARSFARISSFCCSNCSRRRRERSRFCCASRRSARIAVASCFHLPALPVQSLHQVEPGPSSCTPGSPRPWTGPRPEGREGGRWKRRCWRRAGRSAGDRSVSGRGVECHGRILHPFVQKSVAFQQVEVGGKITLAFLARRLTSTAWPGRPLHWDRCRCRPRRSGPGSRIRRFPDRLHPLQVPRKGGKIGLDACSSPISAKTLSYRNRRLSGNRMKSPERAINSSRPAVLRATDLPPVLGR